MAYRVMEQMHCDIPTTLLLPQAEILILILEELKVIEIFAIKSGMPSDL